MVSSLDSISKPSCYYDTIIRYYDRCQSCHKGKQGEACSHYNAIITLSEHYYGTNIFSIITSIMTLGTIMTLLKHIYDIL
jgi:hypothetical protein